MKPLLSRIEPIALILFISSALLFGCGSDSAKPGAAAPTPNQKIQRRMNWATIPSKFSPQIEEFSFRTDGVERIGIDVFGFSDDAEVVYESNRAPDTGMLRIYKVSGDVAAWGNMSAQTEEKTLELQMQGRHECSIEATNDTITNVKGGCYIRLQVILPVGSQIEVYNAGTLLTRRFIPIAFSWLLKSVDRATWPAEKFAAIEDYLSSYAGTNQAPTLSSEQLAKVLSEFNYGEEKLKALGRLHTIVTDRENLSAMIESVFMYFDRAEARRIVGI